MTIYFCEHAAARMFEYGLNPGEVRAALADPWLSQEAIRGRTEHYIKLDHRLLNVITVEQLRTTPRNNENIPIGATVVVTVIVPNPGSRSRRRRHKCRAARTATRQSSSRSRSR